MPLSDSILQPEHPEGENLSGWQVYIIPDNKIGIFSPLFPAADLYLPVVGRKKGILEPQIASPPTRFTSFPPAGL